MSEEMLIRRYSWDDIDGMDCKIRAIHDDWDDRDGITHYCYLLSAIEKETGKIYVLMEKHASPPADTDASCPECGRLLTLAQECPVHNRKKVCPVCAAVPPSPPADQGVAEGRPIINIALFPVSDTEDRIAVHPWGTCYDHLDIKQFPTGSVDKKIIQWIHEKVNAILSRSACRCDKYKTALDEISNTEPGWIVHGETICASCEGMVKIATAARQSDQGGR